MSTSRPGLVQFKPRKITAVPAPQWGRGAAAPRPRNRPPEQRWGRSRGK